MIRYSNGMVHIQDPYYKPIIKTLDGLIRVMKLSNHVILGEVTVDELFGHIVVEFTSQGFAITFGILWWAKLLAHRIQDRVGRWVVARASHATASASMITPKEVVE